MNVDAIEELVERRLALMEGLVKPRLRFDKVALRFVKTVKAALRHDLPDGVTVVFTIAAPIRVASKTAAELEEKIRKRLVRRSAKSDFRETMYGNDIRARVLDGPRRRPNVVGFVHTAESSAAKTLLDVTESVVKSIR